MNDKEALKKKLEYQVSIMNESNIPVKDWCLYKDQLIGILSAVNFDTEDKIIEFVDKLIIHSLENV